MSFLELQWWVYVSLVASFFGICLGLNYMVKKFNEAKIEERLIRMLQKASTTQSTQVTGPLIAVETSGVDRISNIKTLQDPSHLGISLVFNREENKRRNDPYNLIKPLNPRISLQTINIISPSERIVTSVPIRRVESGPVVAKAKSSDIITEKVLVKKNEFGPYPVKENSSTTIKSDCYVTELISVRKNEFGHICALRPLSVTRKYSNTSETVSTNESARQIPTESSPLIHVQDVIDTESVTRKESGPINADVTAPSDPTESVTEKLHFNVKKPTDLSDKKTNEEVDTNCSIIKSIESIMTKFANLNNKNANQQKNKNATNISISTKQSLPNTGSFNNVTEINTVEKKASRSSAAKETSSLNEIHHVVENFIAKEIVTEIIKKTFYDYKINHVGEQKPVKNDQSELNVAEKTFSLSHTERVVENFPEIESEHIKATSSHFHSDRVEENIPAEKVEPEDIAVKETTSSHSYSVHIGENILLKKSELEQSAAEEFSHSHRDQAEENIPVKKVESRNETASSHSYSNHEKENYNPVKKVESGHITAKGAAAYHTHSVDVGENYPLKKRDLMQISAKEFSFSHINQAEENIPVKKVESGHLITKDTASTHSHGNHVIENYPVKKVEPGHITAKGTATLHTHSDHVGEKNSVEKIESEHITAKEAATSHSHSDRVGENISLEKIESEHITAKEAATSHSHSDRVEEKFSLEKIESEHITPKEAATSHSHSDRVEEKFSLEKIESEHITPKEAATSHSHSDRVGENISLVKIESQHITSKEAATSHYHNDFVGEDNPFKKRESEHIAINENTSTHFRSDRVEENYTIKKIQSEHTTDKETTSSRGQSDRVGENFPLKKRELEQITAKEISLHAVFEPFVRELVSVKKCVTMFESRRFDSEKAAFNVLSNFNVIEYLPIKMTDSERIFAEVNASYTRNDPVMTELLVHDEKSASVMTLATLSHNGSDISVNKPGPIKKKETESFSAIETSNSRTNDVVEASVVVEMTKAARNAVLAKRALESKQKEEIESENLKKETEDGFVIFDESVATYNLEDEPTSKTLVEKIVELLEDEDTMNIKLYKPSSSSKK